MPGKYTLEIERGPEYELFSETFTLEAGATKKFAVELKRIANMPAEGWWPGDLHVHRPVEDIELLMRAEDLHIAPGHHLVEQAESMGQRALPEKSLRAFDDNRFYHVLAGEDEREGGAMLYFHLDRPLAITDASREYPSPLKFAGEARKQRGAWIDVEKPFWWDMPVWVAHGQVDSIGLANNHMCRDRMYESEAWGKPPQRDRAAAGAAGQWFLDAGGLLPFAQLWPAHPAIGGQRLGVLPNPVGYDRVYVHVGKGLTWEKWWNGLRAGRSFVTNGPLLRVTAGGELPGHIFTAAAGEELKVEIKAELIAHDKIHFVEIVKDGEVESRVKFEDVARTGSLGSVSFKSSGWLLVRAIADNPKTFRFASTAPFYVEVGDAKHRVSKRSARFFLDWVRERAGRVTLEDRDQHREVLQYHTAAEKFWQEMVNKANAD